MTRTVGRVSPAALALARAFDEDVKRAATGKDWVITFHWAVERRVRSPGGPWEDLGPGFDLATYERHQVPAHALQTVDGMEFAIVAPRRVYAQGEQPLIDRDDQKRSKLTLR